MGQEVRLRDSTLLGCSLQDAVALERALVGGTRTGRAALHRTRLDFTLRNHPMRRNRSLPGPGLELERHEAGAGGWK